MNIFTFDQTVYQPFEKLGGPVDLSKNPVLLRVWSEKPRLIPAGAGSYKLQWISMEQ